MYSLDDLLQSEERHKEAVYAAFDNKVRQANNDVSSSDAYVRSGSFEDQDSFTAYSSRASAWAKRHEAESLYQHLYHRPYFAHIEAQEQGLGWTDHFYLSDNEYLETIESIGDTGTLVPFKQDKNRPILAALFHCYQSKNGEEISYFGPEGEKRIISALLICDDEIKDRRLLNAMQLYPEQDIVSVDADELLEQILQENRSNPVLRNIIATLQQQQFRIIETDVRKNFVVQGCAGSGKSQCLFHRLFFLRDTLSQDGWDRVLLLTPTQLFRNYSSDLIKRYRLSDINDCSVAELYQSVLNLFDPRFKNRQYQFELSEEYLPDEYLRVVYDRQNIEKIDKEIDNALEKYVTEGCNALGIPVLHEFDADDIKALVIQLAEAIQEFDSRETILQQEPDYILHREQYETSRKKLDAAQKTIDRLRKDQDDNSESEKQLHNLVEALDDAEAERSDWIKQRQKRLESARRVLLDFDKIHKGTNPWIIPILYMKSLHEYKDLVEGETFAADEEYQLFLNDYYAQAEKDLKDKLGNQSVEKTLQKLEKKKKDLSSHIELLMQEITQLAEDISQQEEWLRIRASQFEGEQSTRTLRRADMERARYFLSRIESAVFEQEVWKALAPQKELCNVQTLKIDELPDGRKRETRILYKSDLLFYIKIYTKLHSNPKLPDYSLLCIDEGQDLHPADYELLKQLFPNAAFNVFGDLEQSLHVDCGVKNWKKETGIDTVFELDRNYRNAAGIVEFCNQRFGSSMKYVGKADTRNMPVVVDSIRGLLPILLTEDVAIIVKDRNSFERLNKSVGNIAELAYLDTNAKGIPAGKIACYSIYAAKGLEFRSVLVISAGMTTNQRIVACTRATEKLFYYE